MVESELWRMWGGRLRSGWGIKTRKLWLVRGHSALVVDVARHGNSSYPISICSGAYGPLALPRTNQVQLCALIIIEGVGLTLKYYTLHAFGIL